MKKIREPINTITHLLGAILSIVGLVILLIYVNQDPTFSRFISIIIFGISLIFLYSASTIFHMVVGSDKLIKHLQMVDHSMIFILIAGTYTPFCILSLDGAWKYSLLSVIWALAFAGIMLSVFYINMPKFIKTTIYIFMGWIAIIAIYPLYLSISFQGVFFLILGGLFYTIGGIIYVLKKPRFSLHFGSHELFHLFVILGSLSHYFTIFKYVIR